MLSTKHILILPLGVDMSKLSPLTAEKLRVRQLSSLPKHTELNGIFLVSALALTKIQTGQNYTEISKGQPSLTVQLP